MPIPTLRTKVLSDPALELREMSAGVFIRFRHNLANCSEAYRNREITWYDWKVFIVALSLFKDGKPLLHDLTQPQPSDQPSLPGMEDSSPAKHSVGKILDDLTPDQFMETVFNWIDQVPKDWIDDVYKIYEDEFDSVSEEAVSTLKND